MNQVDFGELPPELKPSGFWLCIRFIYEEAPENAEKLADLRQRYGESGTTGPDNLVYQIIMPEANWVTPPGRETIKGTALVFSTTFFPSEDGIACDILEVWRTRLEFHGDKKIRFDTWLDSIEARNRQEGFHQPRSLSNAFPFARKIEGLESSLMQAENEVQRRKLEIQHAPDFKSTLLFEIFKTKGFLDVADFAAFFGRSPNTTTEIFKKKATQWQLKKEGREWRFTSEIQASNAYIAIATTRPRGRPKGISKIKSDE